MPNWCFTNITMTGQIEKVQFLHDKIKEWTSKDYAQNGFGNSWLGNIVLGSGIASEEDIDKRDNPRCRGTIINLEIDFLDPCAIGFYFGLTRQQNAALKIQTETAWNPMMKMWSMINERYNLGLDITYTAEESGCELYLTNDPIVAGTYIIDAYDMDDIQTDYGIRGTYVVRELQKLLSTTESDIEKLINIFEESEYSDHMTIGKYSYLDIEDLVE